MTGVQTCALPILLNAHGFFKYRGKKFIFHCCTKPLEVNKIPLIDDFVDEINGQPEIVNFFGDTYLSLNQNKGIKPADYDKHGWMGHHGAEGNRVYAEFLISKYKEVYDK